LSIHNSISTSISSIPFKNNIILSLLLTILLISFVLYWVSKERRIENPILKGINHKFAPAGLHPTTAKISWSRL
jgi:hypothetical protein